VTAFWLQRRPPLQFILLGSLEKSEVFEDIGTGTADAGMESLKIEAHQINFTGEGSTSEPSD